MEHTVPSKLLLLVFLAFMCCGIVIPSDLKAQETPKSEETERVKAVIIYDIHAGIRSLKGKYEALANFDDRSLGLPEASGRPSTEIYYQWQKLSDGTRYGTITLFIRWSERDYLPQFMGLGGPVTDDFRVKEVSQHLWVSLLTNEGFPAAKQEKISIMFQEIQGLIRSVTGSTRCESKTMYNYAWNFCE